VIIFRKSINDNFYRGKELANGGKSIGIGLCGLGTVGSGTFNLLGENQQEIRRRTGVDISLIMVACLEDNPECDLSQVNVSRDVFDVVNNPDVDIIVELIGGTSPARQLILEAIAQGKHVVTANKALIATHGDEIFAAAQQRGVMVCYEAAIAGAIPVVKAIREGLSANRIDWLAGIINGTSNFILTEMEEKRRDFADVLAEAQKLGYAEADPTFDIEGIDAAHKLTLLSSIAFGVPIKFDNAYTEGISKITQQDISYASELGYRIKHLGISRLTEDGIELRVHPTLIHTKDMLANVNGPMNAVLVHSDAAGNTMYYGAGAGSKPTASAVVADIIDVVRHMDSAPEKRTPYLGFQSGSILDQDILPIENVRCAYYLRMDVLDKTGVMASISTILSRNLISIEALIQKEAGEFPNDLTTAHVPIVIITNRVVERSLNKAITEIEALDEVNGEVTRIRVEALEGDHG
jgi:homoserine dehydrogenase